MKTTFCKCGNRLFFNNHTCLACGRSVGRCGECRKLTSFSKLSAAVETETLASGKAEPDGQGGTGRSVCDQPGCGREVSPCSNRSNSACTSFVGGRAEALCEWCQFTTLIPDLDISPNLSRWIALEAAKRRLLAELEALDLPPYLGEAHVGLVNQYFPLSFRFPAPALLDGVMQPVITGHAEGVITINAEEADSERREATRVALGEPQRTLIGHMRHEIGHYLDWCYAWQVAADKYRQLFGDPMAIDYEQSKQRHYNKGAPADWPTSFVSAYGSMHPWEDFAETVNAYLDLMAIAQTARDQKLEDIDTSYSAAMPGSFSRHCPWQSLFRNSTQT